MHDNALLKLIIVMAPLSFVSIGGATGIYAPLQHEVVDVEHWLNPREFLDLFALARVTPGPGSMLATLIGWKLAGFPGALVATISLYLPSSALCFGVAKVWNRYRGTPWHKACEAGLTPVDPATVPVIPEPSTWVLLAMGAVILLGKQPRR